ncbi:MAG: sigma-54 dependent transcriptional regulator, partial [Casimicrobiaceae bacterium]|nr:sigma-54 dependent transcriptional regulator [Casimicrobiaceae bacterium]
MSKANANQRVLVVDDEEDLRTLMQLTLTKLGLEVVTADSVAGARKALREATYSLCLTDMRLGDGSGLDVLAEINARRLDLPCAVITAYGNTENAVAALKAGAFDYLAKPVSLDQLRTLVKSALKLSERTREAARLETADERRSAPALMPLLGESPAMQAVREAIARFAPSNTAVHIYGESGTGKELAARALHAASPRANGPFVAVNCGAIPEPLMESEFFGYRKGAFTGAERDREGFFQAAHGGTLFLDEVADLPLNLQVKLLRAIQEKRV